MVCFAVVDALRAHHPIFQTERDALDNLAENCGREIRLENIFALLVGDHGDVCLKELPAFARLSFAKALNRRNFSFLFQTLVDASRGVTKPGGKKTDERLFCKNRFEKHGMY